jgi:hypothetical protein
MANDLSARPWFIDTAASTAIWKYQVYIKFIEVLGGATVPTISTQMAIVNDQNSKNIINSWFQTAAAQEIQTYNLENWFNGIIVPTLGTTVTLRIHVK